MRRSRNWMGEQVLAIIIAGPPKSGKSQLARAVATDLATRGYAVRLTDEGRETFHGPDTGVTGGMTGMVRIETLAAYKRKRRNEETEYGRRPGEFKEGDDNGR